LADTTLTLVPWGPGTTVGAYPRRSEQHLDDLPPTMVPVAEISTVEADASLSFSSLADGEYWAIETVGGAMPTAADERLQYVAFNVETPVQPIPGPPGPPGPEGPPGPSGGGLALWLYDNAQYATTSMLFAYAGAAQFVIAVEGDYLLSMSTRLTAADAFTAVVAGIGVNGAVDERAEIWREGDVPANEPTTVTVTCVAHLPVGAVVRPMFRQTSGSTATVSKTTITAQKVG
jgi:hypothetical protein